jgi:branched-chain amino acid transport system substrate-binding protein
MNLNNLFLHLKLRNDILFFKSRIVLIIIFYFHLKIQFKRTFMTMRNISQIFSVGILCATLAIQTPLHAESGLTDTTISLGSVLALKGKAKGLGEGMKTGLEAAFKSQKIKGREVELLFENDFYEPEKTVESTQKLIDKGIFLMIGNVGTPTTKAVLPLLKKDNVPAVGFFTGAGLLREGSALVINYRASYIQETASVIDAAIANGLNPNQVCAYVQNDSYGMAGLTGVKLALERAQVSPNILSLYDKLLTMTGDDPDRNNLGPVGVYRRNTVTILPGYESLKNWEKKTGQACKLIITVGAYANIAHFARNAIKSGENWIISAVSFTGADDFWKDLKKYDAIKNIVMSQVVPLLDSDLPIVQEAKQVLGQDFGFVSLEGYIVGKMTVKILNDIEGELTRDNFIAQVKKSHFDLGGIDIDFTESNDFQASNQVILSYLTDSGYQLITESIWKEMLK